MAAVSTISKLKNINTYFGVRENDHNISIIRKFFYKTGEF